MEIRQAFRDIWEIVLLRPNTIDNLVMRTDHTREELIEMMKKADSENSVVYFALIRLEKLS